MARHGKRTAAQIWQERLARFEKSGLTVKAFCAQEGVSDPSFYYWRKRLQKGHPESSQPTKPAFQTVHVVPVACGLSVELPNGTRLEVPADQLELARVVVQELTLAAPGRRVGDR